MQLQEIMSTRVASACPEDDLEAAHERMRRTGIHHLVVVDRHKVVGILTDSEATRRLNEGASTVETAMFMHVLTATPEMTVADAAAMLRGRPEGALPVLEGRRLVGIVTLSDLLDLLVAEASAVTRPAHGQHRR